MTISSIFARNMNEAMIYIADRIFTGESWVKDHAVVVENGLISELIPDSSLSSSQNVSHFDNCFLAPAFIDLQIYGAYGKLLAVYPEPASLRLLREYCEKGGAAWCLPTVATNTKAVFLECIDAVRAYWDEGGRGILGIHLEGPWINPVKKGAHVESLIHSPAVEEVKELLDHGKGIIRMITLAPEVCSKQVIDLILSHGIVISAGHSNATYEEARNGFAGGITAVTHLYNAMSPLQHRAPGLVGAAMHHDQVMASIIPDGHHVDYAAVSIAKQAMGERLFVITDAVTETSSGYYQHALSGDKYEAANILSGSALDMGKAVRNLVDHVGVGLAEALRMCSLYPAKVMNMKDHGKIERGYSGRMVVMNDQLEVKTVL